MNSNVDILHGNLFKGIFLFSMPLVFSNLLQVLFNLSDIAVVGKFAGAEALGSVGSTSILTALFISFLIGLSTGANVYGARYLGKKDDTNIKRNMFNSFIVMLSFGLLITIGGEILTKKLLLILNTKDELIDGALAYLRIFLLGMPSLALFDFGNALYSSDGQTKKPLQFMSLSGIINVCLNLYFVIVLKMSVVGVALASVISQWLSATMILVSLSRCDKSYRLNLNIRYFDSNNIKEILQIGLFTGLQNVVFYFANLFVQKAVNSFSAVVVEGNSAATNADNLIYDMMAAFYTACTTFMSQAYGAKDIKRVKNAYLVSLMYSFLIGEGVGVLLAVFGKQFLFLFANDKQVIEAGMDRLKIMGYSYGFSAFMDCTIAASRGLGHTKVPTFIVIMGSCVFRIIWLYTVFAYFKTISSIYLLYIFSWTITALFEIIYFTRIYSKAIRSLSDNNISAC